MVNTGETDAYGTMTLTRPSHVHEVVFTVRAERDAQVLIISIIWLKTKISRSRLIVLTAKRLNIPFS